MKWQPTKLMFLTSGSKISVLLKELLQMNILETEMHNTDCSKNVCILYSGILFL